MQFDKFALIAYLTSIFFASFRIVFFSFSDCSYSLSPSLLLKKQTCFCQYLVEVEIWLALTRFLDATLHSICRRPKHAGRKRERERGQLFSPSALQLFSWKKAFLRTWFAMLPHMERDASLSFDRRDANCNERTMTKNMGKMPVGWGLEGSSIAKNSRNRDKSTAFQTQKRRKETMETGNRDTPGRLGVWRTWMCASAGDKIGISELSHWSECTTAVGSSLENSARTPCMCPLSGLSSRAHPTKITKPRRGAHSQKRHHLHSSAANFDARAPSSWFLVFSLSVGSSLSFFFLFFLLFLCSRQTRIARRAGTIGNFDSTHDNPPPASRAPR